MNPTLKKYGYPKSLVHEYCNWAVLIRPWQLTLGDLVIVNKGDAGALGQVSPEAFLEFGKACRDLEAVLFGAFHHDKINYIVLMMADPNVHFHVIPRYSSPRDFQGTSFPDAGWPKPPDMTFNTPANPDQLEELRAFLSDNWPST